MRSFFDLLTRLALRFRALTLAIVVVIMTLGGIAATELQQELLPPIEFPQRFVLIQVSGMTSEEVLNVVTLRVEDEVAAVPGVVNVESQTSSNIGVFLLVSTQFGLDQDEIAADIQDALNSVYFPGRLIEPAEGQSVEALSTQLMGDLPADVPLYLFSSNPSLMYQLTPEVWASLSDETAMTLLQFLATETNTPSGDTSALELLVDAEIVPQLEALIRVARVDIEGGQALPGESAPGMEPVNASEFIEPESLLLQLPPESWDVLAERFDLGELNQATVDSLINENITIPANAPALPESWQAFAGFTDATDLAEMASFTRTSASVFNNFVENGEIRGALGTTEDLTVEDVQAMLEIEPNLANYFDGEQLAAMPPEVVDVLEEYVELDGLSRDALAASLLARDLTGDVTLGEPERLPAPWRLNPPEIISFSFADLPLATFSVFSTATPGTQEDMPDDATTAESTDADNTDTSEDSATANPADAFTIGENPAFADAPEGPPLPELYGVFAEFFNYELDTADDLLRMQFPPEIEPLLGGTDGAAFLNLLPQIGQLLTALGGDADSGDAAVPEFGIAQIGQLTGALVDCNINSAQLLAGGELNFGPIGTGMIACLEPAVFEYLSENDPAFGSRLSPEVYANLSPEVFAIDGYAPLLGDPWQSLGDRPEFADQPLRNADNLIALGDGNAAQVLNTINDEITGQFVGYEVRLFDSLSVPAIDYIATNDTDFYSNLSSDVLLKFSPDVLANLPDSALDNFDADTVAQAQAIADGSAESAAAQIASEYESDIAEARPEAPELNDQWDQIAGFYGVELNNAFDLIRFESVLGGPPATFINNLFASPNGASFAPALLGNMPLDAFTYIADEDPNFIPNLEPRALNLLSEEVFNSLPEETQERAAAGEVFVPSTQVTRTNGAPSLLVTIFKTSDANTVTAFAEVERIINEIDANNDAIEVEVAFEQASFIEESISGVVVSGLLGAFFAIVNILIFLSGDSWSLNGRRISGTVLAVIGVVMAVGYYLASGQDFATMIAGEGVLVTFLIGFIIVAAIAIILLPTKLPYPAWRATLVIAVSIPLSIMSALALMRWLPGIANGLLGAYDDIAFVAFLLRFAPEGLTLNIMTLSGLTVAVGRLVDDSIVVLENIFRQLQDGAMEKREAVLYATRDVSVAIFSATSIAVLVFLPLGLTGGLIAEFFLPFGLAVTYTLLSSFVVAITVVPVLAYFLISEENVPEIEESVMERTYIPVLSWVLDSGARRWGMIGVAILSVVLSGYLFSQRPAAFLPEFGEVQLSISVGMPEGTGIIDTNAKVTEVEAAIRNVIPEDELETLRVTIGGGGLSFDALIGGGGVSENIADVSVSVAGTSEQAEAYVPLLEEELAPLFTGAEENFSVAAATFSSGGFGGFELQLTGAPLADIDPARLQEINADVIATLEELDDLENATSNLPTEEDNADAEDTPVTFIRVCGQGEPCSPAIIFSGDLLTEDTINFTTEAIEAIEINVELPEGVTVGQGFDSELQSEGFNSIIVAMGIALVMIVAILVFVFRSPVYWFAVLFSVIVAPVGAAIALTVTNNSLGISSLIGLLMLLGLVVTNAIVLIDRVGSNREERGMDLYTALVEAGRRRLRPIVMTALTTIIGLIPLALGVSEGAIIAAQLGAVVIGGIISSTLLMLLMVPAAYYLFTPVHDAFMGMFGGGSTDSASTPEKEKSAE